jgi:Macrocin-O-methyltransferase (TylF)
VGTAAGLCGVEDLKLALKVGLTRLGAVCSAGMVYGLNGTFNYLHVGWWLRAHGFEAGVRVASRYELFDLIALEIGERDVLYLEFGVHTGTSIRYWAHLLRSPRSRLHGFDSFAGLPHDWSLEGHGRGYFSTGGAVPEIDDSRIEFFPGWFEETLPNYVWPEHDVLVVMMDADLYSSTATALSFVRERLRPGSYLYFDQFHHRCDELRAFAELLDEHDMRFRLVGAGRELSNVLFQRLP